MANGIKWRNLCHICEEGEDVDRASLHFKKNLGEQDLPILEEHGCKQRLAEKLPQADPSPCTNGNDILHFEIEKTDDLATRIHELHELQLLSSVENCKSSPSTLGADSFQTNTSAIRTDSEGQPPASDTAYVDAYEHSESNDAVEIRQASTHALLKTRSGLENCLSASQARFRPKPIMFGSPQELAVLKDEAVDPMIESLWIETKSTQRDRKVMDETKSSEGLFTSMTHSQGIQGEKTSRCSVDSCQASSTSLFTFVEAILRNRSSEKTRTAWDTRIATSCTTYDPELRTYRFKPLWSTSREELGEYGVGVQLYFEFHYLVGILFFICFLITLPITSLSLMGSIVEEDPSCQHVPFGLQLIGKLTIANVGACTGGICSTWKDFEQRVLSKGWDTLLRNFTTVLSLFDGAAVVVLFAFQIWFLYKTIPGTIERQDETHVTAADFAIEVDKLPRRLDASQHHEYEQLLRQHFETIVKEDEADGDAVLEVSLVRDYDGAVRKYAQQGRLVHLKENAQLLSAEAKEAGRDGTKYEKLAARYKMKIIEIEDSLQRLGDIPEVDRDVRAAFIMFQTEAHKNRALEQYRLYKHRIFRLLEPARLRFEDHALRVQQACEPEDLLWENLDYSTWRRRARFLVSKITGVCFFFVFLGILSYLKSVNVKVDTSLRPARLWIIRPPPSSQNRCVNICSLRVAGDPDCTYMDTDFNATDFSGRSISHDLAGGCWSSPSCDPDAATSSGDSDSIALRFHDPTLMRCLSFFQPEPSGVGEATVSSVELYRCDVESTDDIRQNCQRLTDQQLSPQPEILNGTRGTHSGNLRLYRDSDCRYDVPLALALSHANATQGFELEIKCFCMEQAATKGMKFKLPPYDTTEKRLCEEWSKQDNTRVMRIVLGVGFVVAMNAASIIAFNMMERWVRYRTLTDLATQQVLNVLCAQFANTGIAAILINVNLQQSIENEVTNTFKIGKGVFDDYSALWFTQVGTAAAITICGQACAAVFTYPLLVLFIDPVIKFFRARGVRQDELLRHCFLRPAFNIALRAGQSLNIVFCVLTFSSGMPTLYLVGAIYCFTAYWSDKITLLRGTRKPPGYREDVIQMTTRLIAVALLVHISLSLWIYGSQRLMPSDWGEFVGVLENLILTSRTYYEQVMTIYESSGTTVRKQYFTEFLRVRFLDIGRQGCFVFVFALLQWPLFYTIWPTCYVIWLFLRKPPQLVDNTKVSYREAKDKCTLSRRLFSYKIAANPSYKFAANAFEYDPHRASCC